MVDHPNNDRFSNDYVFWIKRIYELGLGRMGGDQYEFSH